jgi:hypothetical protein
MHIEVDVSKCEELSGARRIPLLQVRNFKHDGPLFDPSEARAYLRRHLQV